MSQARVAVTLVVAFAAFASVHCASDQKSLDTPTRTEPAPVDAPPPGTEPDAALAAHSPIPDTAAAAPSPNSGPSPGATPDPTRGGDAPPPDIGTTHAERGSGDTPINSGAGEPSPLKASDAR